MQSFVQPGNILPVIAPYDRASPGLPVLVGSLFGVTKAAAASGAPVTVEIVGVHEIPKVSAQAWTQGAKIYWDDAAKLCTTSSASGANQYVGVATVAAANPSATGFVRLNGFGI